MTKQFRFGVQLHSLEPESWIEEVRKLESLGYSSVLWPDHFGAQLDPTTALAAVAAVSMAVLSVREGGGEEVDWFDTLVDAQAVVMGERADSDSALRYGFDLSDDTSVPLFADPAWDSSADTVWDSNEALDLGHEYEVLAFWLAAPTDGDDAANTPGVP